MSLSREIEGKERIDAAKLAPITIKLSRTELEIRTGAAEVRDRQETASISRFAKNLLESSPKFKASVANQCDKYLAESKSRQKGLGKGT